MFDETFVNSLERNLSGREIRAFEPPENSVLRAAVMAVLRPGGGGAELCLIKRAPHPLDRFSGHIALPGGAREKNDPDMLATAVRETFEETGMDLERCGRVVGRLDDEMPASAAKEFERSYLVTPFVCVLVSEVRTRVCEEVERIFWMPASDLKPRAGANGTEFLCQGQRVWGMTARIVGKLLEVVSSEV